MTQQVLNACKAGISAWQQAFNTQDAKGCAEQYAEDTTMIAKPFGTFIGRKKIQAFWQNIMNEGYSNVNYTNTKWTQQGEDGYILTSNWTMNKAFGVVHKEYWKMQNDGKARLVYDEFEVKGSL